MPLRHITEPLDSEAGAQGAAEPARQNAGERLADGTAVLLIEEDPATLQQLCGTLPEAWGVQTFTALDDANGAYLQPGAPVVIVLGPSQATPANLERVGRLLRSTPGTGSVLVVDRSSADLMRLALRAGVNDALDMAAVAAHLAPAVSEVALQLEEQISKQAGSNPSPPPMGGDQRGTVTTVFSPKGGVGKSVIAVNLATALALRTGDPVVLLDLDLQFGDVAVMLRMQPRHTFTDAISAGDRLDETLLRSFLGRHEKSGVYVLAAPTSPSEADQADPAGMLRVLDLLRQMFAYVVIDTPPHLSEVVLQAVAESDIVPFVVAMDVPSVKNARLGLQAFQLLQLPLQKVALVLNRADSKVHLADHDIERALEMRVDASFPSEAVVPQSVNQGVPAVLAHPRSRFTAQVYQLADFVLARLGVQLAVVEGRR